MSPLKPWRAKQETSRLRRSLALGAAVGLAASTIVVAAQPASAAGLVIHPTLTTADLSAALSPRPDITLGAAVDGAQTVSLDDTASFQTMDGFGAAFTDSSASVIAGLPTAARDRLMTDLFDRTTGIGLSFMREPMGSSDYTATPAARPSSYSYDDNGGVADPTLAHFSVDHDLAYVVPVIKQAQQINPDMKLFANDWSPPAWMKTNGSMIPINGDAGTLLTADYPVLAQYYVRFLQAYAAAGVKVWGVTPQNEPTITPGGYAGMTLSPGQESTLITANLAPALAAAGLDTKIIAADDNVNVDYDKALLGAPGVAAASYAMGYHCYGNNIGDITQVTAAYPTRSYLTECSPPPGIAAMSTAQLAIQSTNAGVSGVDTWNLALNSGFGPKMGAGCTNCNGLVTVNPDGTVARNLGFYEMGQFSKFVRVGARHVGSTSTAAVSSTAYRNPDGSDVLVVNNNTGSSQTFATNWNGQGSFSYTLPAGATVTFTTATVQALAAQPSAARTTLYTTTGTGMNQWDFEPAGAWGSSDGNEYSSQPGATASLRFTGSGVTLWAFPNALNGIASISVDGGPAKQVDFSADPSRNPTVMASFGGLDPSVPHTLVETVTATRGSAGQGNYASVISAVTASDTVPPVVTATAAPATPNGRNGWYTGPVTFSVSASDNTDPFPAKQSQVDGEGWQSLVGDLTIAGDGTHVVSVRAVDASGNASTVRSFTVKIDSTAPVVGQAATPTVPDGLNGWYTRPVTVSALSTDNLDPAPVTQTQLDGAAWTDTDAVTVSSDGVHVVSARAVDAAGNISALSTTTVKIDSTPPVSSASVDSTTRTVTLRAADDTAGVAKIQYHLSGGAWTTATGPIALAKSDTVVYYRAVDNAGNVEAVNTVTAKKKSSPTRQTVAS